MNLGRGTPQIITKLTTFLAVTDLGGILVAGLMMKSLSVGAPRCLRDAFRSYRGEHLDKLVW